LYNNCQIDIESGQNYSSASPPVQSYDGGIKSSSQAGNINNGGWGNIHIAPNLTDKVIRIKFVRKVYLILTVQLLFTFGIVALSIFT
jgi:hypothetical protein